MTVLIFAIVHMLPGNVAYAILGEFATPSAVAALELRLGLNDPLPVQYWHWLSGDAAWRFRALARDGAAGRAADHADALGHSAVLAGPAFALVAVAGIGLGVYGAGRHGRLRIMP